MDGGTKPPSARGEAMLLEMFSAVIVASPLALAAKARLSKMELCKRSRASAAQAASPVAVAEAAASVRASACLNPDAWVCPEGAGASVWPAKDP